MLALLATARHNSMVSTLALRGALEAFICPPDITDEPHPARRPCVSSVDDKAAGVRGSGWAPPVVGTVAVAACNCKIC